MKLSRPTWMIILGFVLVLMGAVFPWLMVLQLIKSTFFLNFFSYGASVAGIFFGMAGTALYVREHRKKDL
jgi:hypothetical protein